MSWPEMGEWWLTELEGDAAYESVVTPMLLDILQPVAGALYLDLGSGEGRVMRTVLEYGSRVHGVEMNKVLASRSRAIGPTVIAQLPDLSFLRPDSYDGAYCVLVLEHVPDHTAFFAATASVVKPGGRLALVINHSVWTAPGSTPITDSDGEVLWRPGDYLSEGFSDEPAGEVTVRFHHRPISSLLNAAASVGWSLERMVETPHHELGDQAGIPRLMACRWRLTP
ncbi:MAG: class I SAM-dependent methyltransferase [Acidimicrobiia bacterium]